MKPIRFLQLIILELTLILSAPVRADFSSFSWWDSRFETPGLYSLANGGYTRDARLPDESDIKETYSDFSYKTNNEVARVRVLPPGTDIIDPDGFTARAQSDFWQNHAATRTGRTSYGESENREFYDNRTHAMVAESIWADRWTFSGVGLGSAAVTMSTSFEVHITNSPCTTFCGQSLPPFLIRQVTKAWWYRLYGSIRVFDLDVIDLLPQVDSDEFLEVPREVTAFQVFQQGANQTQDFFSPIEPFTGPMLNARLNPIQTSGTASFVPVAGHRYAVVGRIHIQSRDGADVDAGHTLSLDHVVLDQGLRLHSIAIDNGAQLKILDGTRLTITQSSGDEVTLSFPSVSGITYVVEFKNPLAASNWASLTTRQGDGGVQNVTDSIVGGPARWYRLRIQ